MKKAIGLTIWILLLTVAGNAQLKSYIISVKGDTLNAVDNKGQKQGPWTQKVDNLRGERGYEEEGFYKDDLKEGTWKRYSLENGVKIAEENYRWGKLDGKSSYFTYNGGLERVESWRAMDPLQKYDTVNLYDINDPTKLVDRVIVKNEGVSVKHGTWIYYDPREGTVETKETYILNKLANPDGSVAADDDLQPLDMTGKKPATDKKDIKKPAAVLEFEKKNSGKKKIKSRDGSTGL